MRLIKPGYKILAASGKLDLPYSYGNPKNLIEVAGRTCYKSEDKITKDSSEKFVQMLKNNGHNAMIEHSWEIRYYDTINLPKYKFLNFLQVNFVGTLVAGNIRGFDEWQYNEKNDFCIPTSNLTERIHKEKRWDMLSATVKFVCDRGVSHEIVRHRPPGYAQESTRYCNYSQDKFGNHVTFIIPVWLDWLEEGEYSWGINSPKGLSAVENLGAWFWFKQLCEIETTYLMLIQEGWIPGQARSVLPNSLKTEIVVTADLAEWQHIFSLRAYNPKAHEQMREIMLPTQEDFKKLFPEIFV